MKVTLPLYIDEISTDKIRATVSNSSTVAYNLKMMLFIHNPFFAHSYKAPMDGFLGEEINGICIVPVGKFICMVIKNDGGREMIFLDLIDKVDLVEGIAEKLSHAGLQKRFMQAYTEIVNHPEKHKSFELVVGQADVD